MYDQYGFYSDNGLPGAGAEGRSVAPAARTWVSAASIFRSSHAAAGRRASRRSRQAEGERLGGFGDMFSQFFGGEAGTAAQAARAGRRSRIRAEHRFLAGDQGHAGAAEYQPPGSLRHLQWHRDRPAAMRPCVRSATAPGNVRPDGRRDALQPDLPALRR